MDFILSSFDNINFGEALLFMVIGMVIIIAVLSILVGLLYAIRYIVAAIEKPKKTKQQVDEPVPVEDVDVTDEETVAAVTAAIMCILQEEQKDGTVVPPFKIKKIKHIANGGYYA